MTPFPKKSNLAISLKNWPGDDPLRSVAGSDSRASLQPRNVPSQDVHDDGLRDVVGVVTWKQKPNNFIIRLKN
jgi:hypothetical protein